MSLTVEERADAIRSFLRTFSNDYLRRQIRACTTREAAVKVCVETHRTGGGTLNCRSGRSLWLTGLQGRPQRGLHVWVDLGGELAGVVPWDDVIAAARAEQPDAAPLQLDLAEDVHPSPHRQPTDGELVALYAPLSRVTCAWCGKLAPAGSLCPIALPCPTCTVGSGVWCRRPSEHQAQDLHVDRWRLAEMIDARILGRSRFPAESPAREAS